MLTKSSRLNNIGLSYNPIQLKIKRAVTANEGDLRAYITQDRTFLFLKV